MLTRLFISKLSDWSSDEDTSTLPHNPLNPAVSSFTDIDPKSIILTHMFTLAELAADPTALLDIKSDIRDECAKLGAVTNVVLYDLEEDGIVSVRFQDTDSAKACIEMMDGRFFGGERVEARFRRKSERFRRAGKGEGGEEGDADEEERLEKFGEWLEGGEEE
jgi:HIV Tat-specific factor 1